MSVSIGIVFSSTSAGAYRDAGLKDVDVLNDLSVFEFDTDAEASAFCHGVDDACGYSECVVKNVRDGARIAKVSFGKEDSRAGKFNDVVFHSAAERKAYEKGVMEAEGWGDYAQVEDYELADYRNAVALTLERGLPVMPDKVVQHLKSRDELEGLLEDLPEDKE
ncbi:hypothetical protein [Pseudomonas putida]|uniref:Uncharacterized protein n=1 Tax=Pseudomonas putida TaxID=303 RepID=A0A8I1ED31_PSEPU|nr:hypothetical protein [Pseudomonas putida]MBI6883054.1 hypothetical protein [Pseudomonas putida]